MHSKTASRFSQVKYRALFFSSWFGIAVAGDDMCHRFAVCARASQFRDRVFYLCCVFYRFWKMVGCWSWTTLNIHYLRYLHFSRQIVLQSCVLVGRLRKGLAVCTEFVSASPPPSVSAAHTQRPRHECNECGDHFKALGMVGNGCSNTVIVATDYTLWKCTCILRNWRPQHSICECAYDNTCTICVFPVGIISQPVLDNVTLLFW